MLLQLIDKGYYDYDYERVQKPDDIVKWEDTIKTDDELHEMLSGFGFGIKPKKPQTTEELQTYILKQEHYGS